VGGHLKEPELITIQSGGRSQPLAERRERVEAEAAGLVSLGATRLRSLDDEGLDHYAVPLADPEGKEFDLS
jgi:Glyoxalase-like domain